VGRAGRVNALDGFRGGVDNARPRVRILFVNANHSPAYGGVERWMIDAASGLATRGHRTVLLGRPGTPWLAAAAAAGARVRGDIHGTWAQRVLRVRKGMIAELSSRIADINTNIVNLEASTAGADSHARIDMTVEISDLKHLEKVMKSIRGVEGVLGVERAAR